MNIFVISFILIFTLLLCALCLVDCIYFMVVLLLRSLLILASKLVSLVVYQSPSLLMCQGYGESLFLSLLVIVKEGVGMSPRMESLRSSRIAIQHPFCFHFTEKIL